MSQPASSTSKILPRSVDELSRRVCGQLMDNWTNAFSSSKESLEDVLEKKFEKSSASASSGKLHDAHHGLGLPGWRREKTGKGVKVTEDGNRRLRVEVTEDNFGGDGGSAVDSMSFEDRGHVSKNSHKVNIEDGVNQLSLTEERPIKKVVHDETIGLFVVNEHPELTKARARGWYLLARCTVHVCNSRDMFVDYQPVTGHEVVLEDNSHVDVVGFGTVKLQLDTGKVLTLENVFHIPEITKCLISVAKLTDMDFNVTFRSKKCVINDGLEVVGKGYRE
ncbi:hypothetical protein Tco_0933076 [Tanacetum coccineum]